MVLPSNARRPTSRLPTCLHAILFEAGCSIVFVFSLVMFGRLPAWRQFVARRGLPTPTPYLFRNLALPEWVLFAFVLGGLSPLASGLAQRLGMNLLVVVAFLYLLQGLAIFRSFMVAAGAGIVGTLLAYLRARPPELAPARAASSLGIG